MKIRNRRSAETHEAYVQRAMRYCSSKFRELRNGWAHFSRGIAVEHAMLATQELFCDLHTFGVEHIPAGRNKRSPAIDYLDAGDAYAITIMRINNRFCVGCWGDIVERGNYD